jgi:hypothetical protein
MRPPDLSSPFGSKFEPEGEEGELDDGELESELDDVELEGDERDTELASKKKEKRGVVARNNVRMIRDQLPDLQAFRPQVQHKGKNNKGGVK